MLDKLDTHQITLNIRLIRLIRGIKTDEMARQLGISKSSYSDIETGKCDLTVKRLQKIADIFNVSYALLISKDVLTLQNPIEKEIDQSTKLIDSDVIYKIVKTQESLVILMERLSKEFSGRQNLK